MDKSDRFHVNLPLENNICEQEKILLKKENNILDQKNNEKEKKKETFDQKNEKENEKNIIFDKNAIGFYCLKKIFEGNVKEDVRSKKTSQWIWSEILR